jgi:EAL domain-containing protein (putative c-di-GMP-specific phosphodiesterase class I)
MEQGKPLNVMESPLVDFDAVCQKVRAAVEPARAHAVSLHDENGDVLWLSESSMGPDEHNAVLEAIEAFSNPKAPPILAYDLGDARSAVLLRATSARRAMVGAIMIVLDSRVIRHDEHGAIKFMNPKLQRVLIDFAGMRPDIEPPPEVQIAPEPPPAAKAPVPPAAPAAKAPAKATTPGRKPQLAEPLAPSAPASKVAWTARNRPAASTASTTRPAGNAPVVAAPAARAPAARAASARPAPPAAPKNPAPVAPMPAAQSPDELEITFDDSPPPPATRAPRAQAAPARPAAVQSAPAPAAPPPTPVERVLEDSLDKQSQSVSPEMDRLHAALRKSPISLHVQRLVPLIKGSQLRRYEVLLRSGSDDNAAPQAMLKAAVDNGLGSMIDRRVVTELVGWLVRHPDVWQQHAVMFSVNLTTTALHDEHFIKFVGLCLAKSTLPKAMIAFEVDVATAVKMAGRLGEVAAALDRLGCPLVLDDFSLKTECFDLLRLPGVRYVKLAPEITHKMRTDKLAQASITAVVQMARVLGMHTVAKRMETAAEQEWLTALGVDFVQSHSMSPPASIDSLAPPAKARV